jgi:hypothetical protein
MYRHTQTGRFVLALTLTLALGQAAAAAAAGPAARPGVLAGAGIALVVGLLFSRLTTEVGGGALRFHFGPGVWRKRFALGDIASAEQTRSTWWEGVGVRITGRGMLYNVAAGPAVEVRLRSGKRFRLGTDEPDRLRAALIDGASAVPPGRGPAPTAQAPSPTLGR